MGLPIFSTKRSRCFSTQTAGRRVRQPRWQFAAEALEPRIVLDASVVITELVADNQHGLKDDDGERSDWIEIFNAGDQPANLHDWHLTDDAANLGKWTFPAVTLMPDEYLVVFASGKNRIDPTRPLHTNFKLSADGEYLGLSRADEALAFDFAPQYPPIQADRSFGVAQDQTTTSILSRSADTRVFIPSADDETTRDFAWTAIGYDDASWIQGSNGVGFDNGDSSGFRELFGTDIQAQMFKQNSSAYIRTPFQVDSPAALLDLTMSIQYDDGFVAFLNGQEVARRNAPVNLTWDANATSTHINSAAKVFENIDLSPWRSQLQQGENVLAIQGMNATVSSNDFLIVHELHAHVPMPIASDAPRYLEVPTPGVPNGLVTYGGLSEAVSTDVGRGFYRQPLDVRLATSTLGSTLVYTVDGSVPSLTNGTIVPAHSEAAAPATTLHVSTTTTLRAAVFKDDFLPSSIETQTYVFLEDVIAQPASPPGWPTDSKSWGGFNPDYEMDPRVVDAYQSEIKDDLLAIPTLSIVTGQQELFGESGILQNPSYQGDAWERPVSVELIYPDDKPGFQVNSVMRIAGSDWARRNIAKRSFRLLFKESYGPDDLPTGGPKKLDFPLFAGTSVTSFNSIVLKGRADHSYAYTDGVRAQYIREHWGRDTMGDMGWVTTHGTYVHLYLNGLYWGLYAPFERPDGDFQAAYQGGDPDQWYINNGSSGWKGALGIDPVWSRMISANDYETFEQYLDIDNFIDYMMVNFYAGNVDWPSHNWWAARENKPEAKYQFFQNDTEMTFYGPTEANMDSLGGPVGNMYRKLTTFPEFRLRFADRVQIHMFNDGALTPTAAANRWNERSAQVEQAVVAESARWGDNRRLTPYTRDVEWVAERNRLLTQYFPTRTRFMISQFRQRGLYPTVGVPTLSQHGGLVPAGFPLELTTTATGTIYYTIDGSDPRLPSGEVSPQALLYSGHIELNESTTIRTRTLKDDAWSALDTAKFIVAATPANADNLRIAEINYHPHLPSTAEIAAGFKDQDEFEFIELVNISNESIDLSKVRFQTTVVNGNASGVDFAFSPSSITQLAAGARVLVVENLAAFTIRYGANLPIAGQWTGGLSNSGEQLTLTAGDVTIQQITYSDAWFPTTDGDGFTLEFSDPHNADPATWNQPASWQASQQLGGSPGLAPEVQVVGDSNHDGRFDSSDLVQVFLAGEYEDAFKGNSTYEEGDWDGDGDFTTADFVLVLAAGTYSNAAPAIGERHVAAWQDEFTVGMNPLVARFVDRRDKETRLRRIRPDDVLVVESLFANTENFVTCDSAAISMGPYPDVNAHEVRPRVSPTNLRPIRDSR
ncbi:MAG: lamin tail domain-containing protein [Planctomycetales bacterium]|nr:lamin tail domain-containing protein [Planctomycetales bacterium]MCA9166658.1 lamin tail domain-containing protein [Planctomycetales bacterium]